MFWKIKQYISMILRRTRIICCMAVNMVKFNFCKVQIKGRFPRTRGCIRISSSNPYHISFGSNVIINSGKRWNPVGLGIQTSIISIENGIISIGANVGISNVSIVSREKIVIKDNVLLGSGVIIYDNDFHAINYKARIEEGDKNIKSSPVIIEEGVFIGAGAMVLKGVTIGEHSIVGAGSVVTKSIPANEIWAGNPARFIKRIKQV